MNEKVPILVVDDEEQMRLAMQLTLERSGYQVLTAENGREALAVLGARPVAVCVSDLRMPVLDGEELLTVVREKHPNLPCVMITAYGTISQAVQAMKLGAFDFITKPFAAEDLEEVVERALELSRPQKNRRLVRESSSHSRAIITNDSCFRNILQIATTVARSNASILIQGESGTGKELVARLIHSASTRADGPFVAVNCAALPENLLESEMFGHEKGAFTGALASKIGKFELANGGTILLDEISEMNLGLQAKLLRVLQEREVDRVGGSKPLGIDVRVLATTNRDLSKMVIEGRFREDLFYRINVVPLTLPPLRQRQGDIKLLIEHFVRKFSIDGGKRLDGAVLEELKRYNWPGNVRELENACQRAVLLSGEGGLEASHFLLGAISQNVDVVNQYLQLFPGLTVAEAERRLIEETLKATSNNRTKAAELLGISIRTLRNKLHEYGVSSDVGDDR